MVVMETSKGTVKIELDAEKAPVTVKNFLAYVDEGFHDGTIFHRVIPDFMIQGGGFTADMTQPRHAGDGADQRGGQRHRPVLHQRGR